MSPNCGAVAGDGGGGKKLRVAVDLDEVLGHFVRQLVAFHNEEFPKFVAREGGRAGLEEGDFVSYDFSKVWGGTHEQANLKMSRFFESRHFRETFPVVKGAREVLERMQGSCEFYVVTSRHYELEQVTREWIHANFPGLFRGILLGNHYGTLGTKRSKAELCSQIEASILIDDNPGYVSEIIGAGLTGILFGAYPWNQGSLPDGARQASSWDEVEAILQERIRVLG